MFKKAQNNNTENNNCIRVCVRVRPLLEHEDIEFWQTDKEKNIIYTDNYYSDQNEIINESYALTNNIGNKSLSYIKKDVKKLLIDSIYAPQKFNFDRVYSIDDDSQLIYKEMCKDVVSSALEGYNGSIFMYGQTTSGKTYTMLGSPNNPGILPCTLRDIFLKINKITKENKNINYKVYCSYIEIYNENIHDLLTDSNFLKLIDDKKYGIIVAGAKKVRIDNFETGIGIKDFGEENRKYRETLFNEYSSRSHSIFQIFIESFELTEDGELGKNNYSCLNLIDLAGSERINEYETKNITTGETGYINKSLFVLANVINKLVEVQQGKKTYIPYRDSKLTRLLSQALGGNSLTTIICTVSPASINYYQTLSTLRFATRAKSVKLRVTNNEYIDDKEKIEFYKNEIRRLKEELKNRNIQDLSLRAEGYGNSLNNTKMDVGGVNDDYKQIISAYEKVNNELNNYKQLYFKEKEKSNLYKEQYESLRRSPEESEGFNTNTNSDDRVFVDEIISQIQGNEDSNQIIQNNSNNSISYSKWKDETSKLSQNYKDDLSSLKMAYKQKILMLHNSMFQNNNDNNNYNINLINNNTEKTSIKNKENIDLETPLNTGDVDKKNNFLQSYLKERIDNKKNEKKERNENSIDSRKIIQNESDVITDEELNEDDEVINKINNGEIFNDITLNYEMSDNDNINVISDIKVIYNKKIEELEKSMEHLKSYIEIYYRKKIHKINENGGIDSVGLIDGELPVMKYTSQHQKILKKLRELYENKVKEIESSFFNILKIITAKKMTDMNQ